MAEFVKSGGGGGASLSEARFDTHLLDKTKNRSVVGVMNEFASLAEYHRAGQAAADLEAVAVQLAGTPCGPLYKTHITPDRALTTAVVGSGQDDLLQHRKR